VNRTVENKISRLVEENWKGALSYGMPLAGAAGLGYMGYHAGEDVTDGIESISDRNTNIVDSGTSIAKELFGGNKPPMDASAELKKFLIPGEDGSWRKVGEAIGNKSLGHANYISDENLEQIAGQLKTNGALAGAGLGYMAGKLLSPNKKESN